jgi:hypothetical protein
MTTYIAEIFVAFHFPSFSTISAQGGLVPRQLDWPTPSRASIHRLGERMVGRHVVLS